MSDAKMIAYLVDLGYRKEDMVNPEHIRHFRAFYRYCVKQDKRKKRRKNGKFR